MTIPSGISRRGFASLSPERRREIAAMGGAAGRDTKRGFANMDPERLSEIGRKGGQNRWKNRLPEPE